MTFCYRNDTLRNVKSHFMKKKVFILLLGCMFSGILSCKKDKNNDGNNPDPGPSMRTVDVQIVLPAGSAVDLSKTKILTLGNVSGVGGDGKASVSFLGNNGQLAFVFDEADHLILESYITATSKEISVKGMAQALLLQGLQQNYLPDTARAAFLQMSASAGKMAGYYAQIEQIFKSDALMLEKRSFAPALSEAIALLKQKSVIDMYGKQIRVVDDEERSKIKIEAADVENINVLNSAYRRAHAFIYKTAFKNQNGLETILINKIDYDDKAEKDLKIEKIRFLSNAFDQIGVAQGFKTATTGPINLPVASNEKEATYKIRVLGPGKPSSTDLTDAEKTKLDELYYQYLAYDIVAPLMLDALGYSVLISKINEDALQPFYEKVKSIAGTNTTIMEDLRKGSVHGTINKFYGTVTSGNFGNNLLENSLITSMKTGYKGGDISFPSEEKLTEYQAKLDKGIELLKFMTGVVSGPFILAPHDYYNELEQFEVKSQDNNVKLTPKEASMSTFSNQTLTANANVEPASGQTLVFKWSTTGQYGVLKSGSQQGTSIETTTPTITYYANASSGSLGDNNIDQVFVTVVVKQGSNEIPAGSDTANINVKKNKLVMNPTDAEIDMAHGGSKSVKLYLLKTDGTKDIFPNPSIDHKVVWTMGGSYGQFQNGSASYTAYDNNTVIYSAFENDNLPDSVVENISAKVYFKAKNDNGWIFREEVKGKVTLINNEKKIVYYTGLQAVHTDPPSGNGNRCAVGAMVNVKAMPKAYAYKVVASGLANKNYPVVSDSWTVTPNVAHIRGYAGYAFKEGDSGDDFYFGIEGTFSWTGGPTTEHFGAANTAGIAKVTVWLKD